MKSVKKSELNVDNKKEPDSGRLNRWSVFGFVLIIAIMMILYVDNVKRVDGILKELQLLKVKKEKIKNENELLKSKLNYLQSPDRIMKIAEEKLGMIKIDEAPEILPNKEY